MGKLRTLSIEEAASISPLVIEQYPHIPLDFVRKGKRKGLGNWFWGDIFHPDSPKTALNFIWKGEDVDWVILSNVLAWDSQWFGKKIVKIEMVMPLSAPFERPGTNLAPLLKTFLDEISKDGVDYVFVNPSVNNIELVRALGDCAFSVIETRLTYWLDNLNDFSVKKENPIREATSRDVEFLSRAAAETVNPYDRFHSDPFFEPGKVDGLMREWVYASVDKGFADAVLIPSVEGKEPGALMTAKYHKSHWAPAGIKLSQMVFSVVSPEFRGWYARLVAQTTLFLRDKGAEAVFLTTQAANRAVLRVWSKLGYQFGNSSLVFRKILR